MLGTTGFGFHETLLMSLFQSATFFPIYILFLAYALDWIWTQLSD